MGDTMITPARTKPRSQPSIFISRHSAAARSGAQQRHCFHAKRSARRSGLRGLLPAHVLSQEEQVARFMTNLRGLPDDLDKYVALNALHDRNEALFFRVICDHIDEMQPLIYTPDRRPRLPAVRPYLPAAPRHVHLRQRPRTHRRGAAQLAVSGQESSS